MDPLDVFIAPRKYLDKPILLRKLHCYYADVEDYRCASSETLVAVFATTVGPPAAKEWLEKYCDQAKKAVASDKCLFNPWFTYTLDDIHEDIVSGYEKRKVIRPAHGITMVPSKKIRD